MPPGVVPVGAKVGIDATIGEGIPHERFERIAYAYADRAKIDDYVAGKADAVRRERGSTMTRWSRVLRARSSRSSSRSRCTTRTSPRSSGITLSGRRAGARQAARRRETVAGPARPPVPARLGARRQAADKSLRWTRLQPASTAAASPPQPSRSRTSANGSIPPTASRSTCCTTSISTSRRNRYSRSSAPRDAARARCSTSSRGSCRPTAARCASTACRRRSSPTGAT